MLIHPCFILIDHGHFQYNCVSLGLVLWSIILLKNQQIYLASIFYVCSICFKQMSLYYAPAFFFYLLGISIWKEHGNGRRSIKEM
jgi:alpha-1,3-glucosyltransferase